MEDAERLRRAGLRATRQRLAVLRVLRAAQRRGEHLSVDQIARQARALGGGRSTQAVYNALAALSTVGITRRLITSGPAARYELRSADHPVHAVCRRCGATRDVSARRDGRDRKGWGPEDGLPGFLVEEVEVTLWGTCAECAGSAPTPR